MEWTTVEDVTSRWVGGDAPTNDVLTEQLIDDAEGLVKFEYPDIRTRIDDGALPVERVQFVVSQMVIRALRNPEGVRQRTDVAGPFTESVSYDRAGDIWMTDRERDLLSGAAGAPRQKAFTINTIAPREECTLYGALINGPCGTAPGET